MRLRAHFIGITSSAAYEQFSLLNIQVLQNAGYEFSSTARTLGMSLGLLQLCKEASIEDLHLQSFVANYSAQTEGWADFYHNGKVAVLQTKPLLIGSGRLSAEQFEHLYQQMLVEMLNEQFTAVWHATSIWGKAPDVANTEAVLLGESPS